MSPAMTPESSPTAQPIQKAPAKLWPPIVLSFLAAAALTLPTRIAENLTEVLMWVMFLGPLALALLFLIWWFSFSRTSWKDKFLAFGAVVLLALATYYLAHSSMQFTMMMYFPVLMLIGWTIAFALFRDQPELRRVAIPMMVLPAVGFITLLRFEGVTGHFDSQFKFRFSKSAEDDYLASRGEAKSGPVAAETKPVISTVGDWTAFRGANRDGILRGVKIRTEWKQNPPKQIWRNKIGPGWSSIAVVGDRLYTQEQRGPEEAVVCLNLNDGKEVWSHVDEVRFYEPLAGAGPRATPTFADGRLFAFGAKGVLNALDAATGRRLWSHDLGTIHKEALKEEFKEMQTEAPMWGFSASPLVFGDKVAVFVGGKDKGVAVFNAADGKEVWTGGFGGHSYTSTHLATLAGAPTLLNTTNKGVQGLDPATGKERWNHDWPLGMVVPCVQPAFLGGDRVAIGAAFGKGTRLFDVAKSGDGFTTNEVATHVAFKPYYSDFVLVGDTAYGFDGAIFGCFDLKSGKRIWKGGRYGAGQVLLLEDQNLLLVVSEMDGNVVLVPAERSGHKEIAKFKALTGKSWNHPTVAHGKLLVRNGEEIACFDVAEK